MEAQRLRNLTTGILHTEVGHIYQDLEFITGEKGLMTHMLPRVMNAIEPWLREKVTDARYWDEKFDQSHKGEYTLEPMTKDEEQAALKMYLAQPNPLENKDVALVST